jgi:hypothetical protein
MPLTLAGTIWRWPAQAQWSLPQPAVVAAFMVCLLGSL